MAAHLWADGPATMEEIELYLCKDVYKCLPSQLRAEDAAPVMKHLTVLEMQAKVEKQRNQFK